LSVLAYDLEFDALSLEFDGPDFKVNSDGGDEAGRPGVVAEPEQQARLANT